MTEGLVSGVGSAAMRRLARILRVGFGATACASAASAQSADPLEPAPVSTGTTDLVGDGVATPAAPDAENSPDANHLRLSAGGLLTTGNSRTLALTAAVDHVLRRGPHQLRAAGAVNFGMSAHDASGPYRTSVENAQARVRFDRFLSDRFTTFLALTARRDRFQGLALRLNLDPGLAHYFVAQKTDRLWVELSYDLQHDIRHGSALDAGEEQALDIDEHETRHGARAFVGYDHHPSELLSFSAGLELIQSVEEMRHFRGAADAVVSFHAGAALSFAFALSFKHENAPLPGVRPTDSMSSFSVVYSM